MEETPKNVKPALQLLIGFCVGFSVTFMLVFACGFLAIVFYLPGGGGHEPPRSCVMPTGFTCNEFEIFPNGYVYLDVGQANGRAINMTAFGCNSTGTSISEWHPLGANSVWIDNGRHEILLNGTGPTGQNYAISQCCPATSGSSCKARIAFNYSMSGSILNRTAYGDIGGPVP